MMAVYLLTIPFPFGELGVGVIICLSVVVECRGILIVAISTVLNMWRSRADLLCYSDIVAIVSPAVTCSRVQIDFRVEPN